MCLCLWQQAKTLGWRSGGFLASMVSYTGLALRFSIQPLANIVGGYACQHGDKKGNYLLHCAIPPFYRLVGVWQPLHYITGILLGPIGMA